MDEQKIHELVNLLDGTSQSDWTRIKQHIDMRFSYEAAKVKFGDTPLLKRNLEVEFNLRRFGEK